jgi:hypothetical protein
MVTFSNTTNSTSSGTGAIIVSGGIGVGGRINCESVQIADAIIDSGETSINSTNAEVIDSYPADQFRTAKYLIQIDEGTGPTADFHSVEMLLLVKPYQIQN